MDEELAGELTGGGHVLRQRVYFEDTDFTGVVYHARYLHFLERGRTDFLRLLGVRHSELIDGRHGERLGFVVRHMVLDFSQPARIDDILAVRTRFRSFSRARIELTQSIIRGETLLLDAQVSVAIVNGQGRPRRLPQAIAEQLDRFED